MGRGLQLLHHQPEDREAFLETLFPHLMPSDLNALRDVLKDIDSRLDRAKRF